MSRGAIPTVETAPAASPPLLDAVRKQLGGVANLFRLASLSPAALEVVLGLTGALAKKLDLKIANVSPLQPRRSMAAATAYRRIAILA